MFFEILYEFYMRRIVSQILTSAPQAQMGVIKHVPMWTEDSTVAVNSASHWAMTESRVIKVSINISISWFLSCFALFIYSTIWALYMVFFSCGYMFPVPCVEL